MVDWGACEIIEHVVEKVVEDFSDLWWDDGDLYFWHGFFSNCIENLLNSYISSRRSVIVGFYNED